MLLILGTVMAFAATVLGSVWHAVWAGVPLGLCVVAFLPLGMFQKMGEDWGIREEKGDPTTKEDGLCVDRREQVLLHQGDQRARAGRLTFSAGLLSSTT